MATQIRPPRTRASGGRTLVLIGVLLALIAGIIVIFIVTQATVGNGQMVQVVVAKQDLKAGIELSVSKSDTQHMLISDAFEVKSVAASFAPSNAFQYDSQDDLNVKLDNQVVIGTFYAGDILRLSDPRLVAIGQAGPGSIANINPDQFPSGSVLMELDLQTANTSGKPLAVAGDRVDLIVTECNLPGSKDPGGCETQTTLQNLYVYAITSNALIVVVDRQSALTLQYIETTNKRAEIVLRKPGDDGTVTTSPVDGRYIVKQFGF